MQSPVGVCVVVTLKSHDFILTGDSLTFIVKKKGGEYCKEVKKSFISLDPPPEPSSVVVVKRK